MGCNLTISPNGHISTVDVASSGGTTTIGDNTQVRDLRLMSSGPITISGNNVDIDTLHVPTVNSASITGTSVVTVTGLEPRIHRLVISAAATNKDAIRVTSTKFVFTEFDITSHRHGIVIDGSAVAADGTEGIIDNYRHRASPAVTNTYDAVNLVDADSNTFGAITAYSSTAAKARHVIYLDANSSGNRIGTIVTDSASDAVNDLGSGNRDVMETVHMFTEHAGVLTVAAGVQRFRMPYDGTISAAAAVVNTAPTGAAVIVDVNLNGTTIYTTQANRPTIAIGGNDSGETVPDVTAFVTGDYLTVDADQIGSGTAGSDLVVTVRIRRG